MLSHQIFGIFYVCSAADFEYPWTFIVGIYVSAEAESTGFILLG